MTRKRNARTDLRAMLAVLGHEERTSDGAVRRDVDPEALEHWQEMFEPLTALAPPVEPSPDLWTRIAAATAPEMARAARSAAPSRPAQPAAASLRERLWSSISLWRFATAALASVALGLLFFAAPDTRPADPASYVAVLQAPEGERQAGWIVEVASDQSIRLVPLGDTPVGENQALEFWTKAVDADGPTSLGLVPGSAVTEIAGDAIPPIGPDQLFEITLEPATGSPIGRPTGPILFIGRASAV